MNGSHWLDLWSLRGQRLGAMSFSEFMCTLHQIVVF